MKRVIKNERNKIKILLRSRRGCDIILRLKNKSFVYYYIQEVTYAAIPGLSADFAGVLNISRKYQRSVSIDDSGILS